MTASDCHQEDFAFTSALMCSTCQQFLLGRCELFIGQHTRFMQLAELLKLGRQIGPRWSVLAGEWCIRLLLRLGIGCAF